jgi:hypothetical protein
MPSRTYRSGVTAALMALAKGTCYYPKCTTLLIQFVEDEPWLQVEIAHIRGLRPGSARYDPDMDDQTRNAFINLLLLCTVHHKRVDRRAEEYTTAQLQQWKAGAEHESPSPLAAWTDVTQAKLEAVVSQSFTKEVERLNDAVTRLESVDREAAGLIRPLIRELQAARISRPALSEDVVATLDDASRRLRGLDDSAELLHLAADRLSGLPHLIDRLNDAADGLGDR